MRLPISSGELSKTSRPKTERKCGLSWGKKIDDFLGKLTDEMNGQAETTLSSIAAEVQEKASKMMEESA